MTHATGTFGTSRNDSLEGLPSFAVVVPMFNEEAGAEKCVRAVCGELASLPHRSTLIVVNDGSADNTQAILQRLQREHVTLTLVNHERNSGYGAALQTGVGRAARDGFDYVLFMDSDLTNHPSDIPRFAAKMQDGFDVIKATRYRLGGKVQGVPAYRVMISRAGNWLARLLFRLPISDCTNGFRAVRVALLARMRLQENRFSIIMEELYWSKYLARRFAEVPVTLTNRGGDQRATSFVYRPAVFCDYLKYPVKAFFGCRPAALAAAQIQTKKQRT